MTISKLHIMLNDSVQLLELSRSGISFKLFETLVNSGSFSLKQWSRFLHLTERTLQRYKKEGKSFESIHSERILEIAQLLRRGETIFESKANFERWLSSSNIALGGVAPLELMDNSFGIDLITNELGRIEHGILA